MTKRERRIRRVRFLALLMAVGLFFVNGAEALAANHTITRVYGANRENPDYFQVGNGVYNVVYIDDDTSHQDYYYPKEKNNHSKDDIYIVETGDKIIEILDGAYSIFTGGAVLN